MTFLFAAGVATVVLPIALGAATIRQLITAGHTPVYLAGGAVMLALAAYTLLGGRLHLPAPGRPARNRTGPLGVYTLGLFSGVATSCCAPVLAGVVALVVVAVLAGGGLAHAVRRQVRQSHLDPCLFGQRQRRSPSAGQTPAGASATPRR